MMRGVSTTSWKERVAGMHSGLRERGGDVRGRQCEALSTLCPCLH